MRTIKKRNWRPAIVGPCGPKGRRVFTISWDKRWSVWKCKERGTNVCIYQRATGYLPHGGVVRVKAGEDKRAFVERCAAFVGSYPLAQLIVKTKAGRVAFERTYPRSSDPKRSPG